MSWAHGTTGLGDAGSPSTQPDPARELTLYFEPGSETQIDYGIPGLQTFIDEGWVVVATDYQGLGSPGVHQYTVNRTNAIDAVTIVQAAQEFPVAVDHMKMAARLQAFADASAAHRRPGAPVCVQIDRQTEDGPCPVPWQLGYIDAVTALGGDISSSTYPDDDHFSLPQHAIGEARDWLAAKFAEHKERT